MHTHMLMKKSATEARIKRTQKLQGEREGWKWGKIEYSCLTFSKQSDGHTRNADVAYK